MFSHGYSEKWIKRSLVFPVSTMAGEFGLVHRKTWPRAFWFVILVGKLGSVLVRVPSQISLCLPRHVQLPSKYCSRMQTHSCWRGSIPSLGASPSDGVLFWMGLSLQLFDSSVLTGVWCSLNLRGVSLKPSERNHIVGLPHFLLHQDQQTGLSMVSFTDEKNERFLEYLKPVCVTDN